MLYGGLFFISGAAVLALTYAGVSHTHQAYTRGSCTGMRFGPVGPAAAVLKAAPKCAEARRPGQGSVAVLDPDQRNADLQGARVRLGGRARGHGRRLDSARMVIAGRVLRPLRTITTAARDISATNLHRRLALDGPDDEFKELGDTFDGLLARLDASFQSQRQFVANASHELRTPLARLKTLVQVTLADPNATPESLRAAHERVLASESSWRG